MAESSAETPAATTSGRRAGRRFETRSASTPLRGGLAQRRPIILRQSGREIPLTAAELAQRLSSARVDGVIDQRDPDRISLADQGYAGVVAWAVGSTLIAAIFCAGVVLGLQARLLVAWLVVSIPLHLWAVSVANRPRLITLTGPLLTLQDARRTTRLPLQTLARVVLDLDRGQLSVTDLEGRSTDIVRRDATHATALALVLAPLLPDKPRFVSIPDALTELERAARGPSESGPHP